MRRQAPTCLTTELAPLLREPVIARVVNDGLDPDRLEDLFETGHGSLAWLPGQVAASGARAVALRASPMGWMCSMTAQ